MKNRFEYDSVNYLHKQLVSFLIEDIISNNFQPHSQFYSERIIADKYNTSVRTVKLALKDLIVRDMLYKKPQSGTYIKNNKIIYAGNLAKNKSYNIAYITSRMTEDEWLNPYYSGIIASIESQLEKSGYHFNIYRLSRKSPDREKKLFVNIAQNQLDGIFLAGVYLDSKLVYRIVETGIHVVLVDGPILDKTVNHVIVDDIKGAYDAVEYLIKKGHKKIAYLGGMPEDRASKRRLIGYEKALKSHKIEINKNLILYSGGMNFQNGIKAMQKILSLKDKPTVVFAVDDMLAVGCIKAIRTNNLRVPEDISVVGFDDLEIASHISPGLTTMRIDRKRMGYLSAERMLDLINKRKHGKNEIVVKPRLIERETVQKI